MSIVSKLTVGFLVAACIGMLSAQEIFSAAEPADFTPAKKISKADDALSAKGTSYLFSAKSFALDPAKKYQISGEFSQKGGKQVTLYFGFAPYDANGRPVDARKVNVNKNSLTEVAEDAKKGDKVIKVKDASKWNTKTKYSFVTFGAKEDFSDLPNGNQHATTAPNARQNGEVWEITLKNPLTKDIAAGTAVRQHFDGASYIYTAGYCKLTDQWVTRKGIISGIAPFGNVWNKMWKGTEKVKVLILLLGGDADSEVLFRNIKVSEIK